jgi:hypothetical protein
MLMEVFVVKTNRVFLLISSSIVIFSMLVLSIGCLGNTSNTAVNTVDNSARRINEVHKENRVYYEICFSGNKNADGSYVLKATPVDNENIETPGIVYIPKDSADFGTGSVVSTIIKVDGTEVQASSTALVEESDRYFVYSILPLLTDLDDGQHSLEIETIWDAFIDYVKTESSVSFIVDNTAPEVSINNTYDDSQIINSTIFEANMKQWYLDEIAQGNDNTISIDTTTLTTGTHTIRIVDVPGNETIITFTVTTQD